ncbi:MAG: hypothetical protein AAF614_13690 [Chloroflexota bacterium]
MGSIFVAVLVLYFVFSVVRSSLTFKHHSHRDGFSMQYSGRWSLEKEATDSRVLVSLWPSGNWSFPASTTIPRVWFIVSEQEGEETSADAILRKIMIEPIGNTDFEMVQEPTQIKHHGCDAARAQVKTITEGPTLLEITVLQNNGRHIVIYAHKTGKAEFKDWDSGIEEMVNSIQFEDKGRWNASDEK